MILILFGYLGCGKNYTGRILEQEFGFHFHDADEDLTESMRNAIMQRRIFTDQMRDEYTRIIIRRIHELSRKHRKLAVAQALFKNKHRRLILEYFPKARFIVQADEDIIMTRLLERRGQIATQYYAQKVNRYFETPNIPHEIITNNGSRREIIEQARMILSKITSD